MRRKQPLIEKHYGARKEFHRIRADTIIGMAFSNLIALSIIVTAAATLHAAGKTDIQTSAEAAEALRPIAGVFAEVIFALGIVGTGLLAIPVLAGATAYAVGEGRRWPVGLARKPKEAAAFYAVLALSAGIGIALNFTPINPISALYWSAVINGVLAVPVMVLLMFMARRKDVMGRFVVARPALLARLAVDAGDAAQRRGDGRGVFCREVMGAGRLSQAHGSDARWSEQRAKLCPCARGLSDVVEHRDPFAERDAYRIEGSLAPDQSITERLLGRRMCERAEQAIEYDQYAAVILVEAGLVRCVMHAMMRRCVEHELERTQPWRKLGVDEELIGQVDADHRDDGEWMKSDPDQRQEEQEVAGNVAGPA